MYKVLIADDKQYEREYLRQFIENNYPDDLEVVCEAADGEKALRQIPIVKPDILLLDIIMPKLDGLEIAKQVKETHPHIIIIIISAYAEFSYAKQALKIGVNDYLLKPYMDDELRNTIDSVLPKVDKIHQEILETHANEIEEPDINHMAEKDFLLRAFFDGQINITQESLSSYGIGRGIYKCIIFYSPVISSFTDKAIQVVKNIFSKNELRVRGYKDLSKFVLVIMGNRYSDFNDIDNCIKRAREYIRSGEKTTVLCGISSFYEIIKDLPDAYTSAADIIKSNIVEDAQKRFHDEQEYTLRVYNLEKQISLNIIDKKKDIAKELLRELYELLLEYKELTGYDAVVRYRMSQTIYYVINNVNAFLDSDDREDNMMRWIKEYGNKCNTLDSVMEFWDKLLESLVTRIGELSVYNNVQLVKAAKGYIFEHYSKKISLQAIAEELDISFGYLSKCFKQIEGIGITQYLLKYRIEKAKELMQMYDLNISEVSFKVGFSDPNYFSRCFKKLTGLTPKEYNKWVILNDIKYQENKS